MKTIVLAFAVLLTIDGFLIAEPTIESPLTPWEQSLVLSPAFLRTDEQRHGFLWVQGESLSQAEILSLSAWDVMKLVQTLTKVEIPFSRFGNNDFLTQAWRQKVATFAAMADTPPLPPPEHLFDPALVLWDPGYIQTKNEWGQWTIHLANRDIVQSDLPTLSPLEVQQAVEVLTGRTYPIEFILDHLEAFRAQLSIVPRDAS